MDTIIVNKDNFDSVVIKSELPVVVEFMAPWCGYCKRLAPAIDRMAQKFDGKLVFVTINTDDEPGLFARYGAEVTPTLHLFKNGVPGETLIAPSSQVQVEDWIKAQTAI